MSALISTDDLANLKDAAEKAKAAVCEFTGAEVLVLIAEIERLRDSVGAALENGVASSCGFCRETYMILKRTEL